MILVRVNEQIELFIGFHHRINHLHGILVMYVIISSPMNDEQIAFLREKIDEGWTESGE